MEKIKVKIVEQRIWSYLVQDQDGRQAWIQRRWLDKDNMVDAKIFEENVEWLKNRKAEIEQKKVEAKLKRQELIELGEIVRETEKAVAVTADWEDLDTKKTGERLAWFPKSQVKDGKAPYWLIEAKAVEVWQSVSDLEYPDLKVSLCGRNFQVNAYGAREPKIWRNEYDA